MKYATLLLIPILISLGESNISANAADPGKNADKASRRQEVTVRIELDKDTIRLGEPISGRVIFENRSMSNPVEIFYPGFNCSGEIGRIATSIAGVRPDGTPMFRCQVDHHTSETSCIVTPIQIAGVDGGEDVLQLAEELELRESDPKFAKLDPGKTITFDFAISDCREILPRFAVADGKELPDQTECRAGTYEISLTYLAKGRPYWAGNVQSRAVTFTVHNANFAK